ncbi:MAG: 5-oxoprolinase subunit PxpA [Proteobacteria bacterium]|nr:5-oxoprolinase subunit PxpA [Pseudomonadota bacterium]MBS0550172.1 5-oxoprolinase subunit PxpA [Pseudomonadota bacterium]
MSISLNCDLGEGYGIYRLGDDEAIMEFIDIANVACGFHASDPTVMRRTVAAAKENGVEVGAHPSLPDRQGFGRREMQLEPQEMVDLVTYQVGALRGFLDAAGMPLRHIKPHGALYGMAARDRRLSDALCTVAKSFGVPLMGLAGTHHEAAARDAGVTLMAEFYADLDYLDDGNVIAPRVHEPIDPAKAVSRVQRAFTEGLVTTVGNHDLPVRASTICVHSDTPTAVEIARQIALLLPVLPAAR